MDECGLNGVEHMRAVWKQKTKQKQQLLGTQNWKMCIPFENSHLYMQRERNVLQRNQLPTRVSSMISSYSHRRVWESPGLCGGLGKGDERRGRRLAAYFCAYVSGAFKNGEVLAQCESEWFIGFHFKTRKLDVIFWNDHSSWNPSTGPLLRPIRVLEVKKKKWCLQIITALELIGLKN